MTSLADSPGSLPIRVLIVDDDTRFLTTLRDVMEMHEFEVRAASSGLEALEVADGFTPDCILMDVVMPGLTGIDTLRGLKPLPPETFVIFMTGHASHRMEMQARLEGALDVVSKPLDLKHLVSSIVETAADRRQSRFRCPGVLPGHTKALGLTIC